MFVPRSLRQAAAVLVVFASTASPALAAPEGIVFTRDPGNNNHGGDELWLSDANGGNRRQVATGVYGMERPVLSPDGSTIAFTSSDGGVWTIGHDGANKRNVLPRPDLQTWWERPTFSPDGLWIYVTKHVQIAPTYVGQNYVDRYSIHRVPSAGGAATQIVAWAGPNGPDQGDATLSRDGTRLAFSSGTSPTGADFPYNGRAIFVTDADGGNPRQVTPDPVDTGHLGTDSKPIYTSDEDPAFSADAARIAYVSDRTSSAQQYPDNDILLVGADGGGASEVTISSKYNESTPAFSSTGELAFGVYPWIDAPTDRVEVHTAGGGSLLADGSSHYEAPSYGVLAPLSDAALLQHYRPHLKYDALETYRADSAAVLTDAYVAGKNGRSNQLKTSGGKIIAASDPALRYADLNLPFLSTRYPTGATAQATDLIDAANPTSTSYQEDAQRMHALAGYGNRVHGRLVNYPDGTKVLQYWLFYYNNPKTYFTRGAHEGDWELVQVHLGSDQQPVRAAFAQHGGGERCDWVNVQRTTTGQPIVYVAEGSHASYFSSGYHFNEGADDTSNGDGEQVGNPTVVDIGGEPGYIAWPGRWGGTPDATAGSQSPPGPKYQGEKWTNPLAWANGVDGCTEGQTQAARRGGQRPAARRRRPPAAPTLPAVSARRRGDRVVIAYRFASPLPSARARRPAELLTGVDSRRDAHSPLTVRSVVRGSTGRVSQRVGLASGRLRVLVSVVSADGTRSRTITIPVR